MYLKLFSLNPCNSQSEVVPLKYNMTTEELFKHITSKPNWYKGKINKQMASYLNTKHTKGQLTMRGYIALFDLFNYQTDIQQVNWTIKPTNKNANT